MRSEKAVEENDREKDFRDPTLVLGRRERGREGGGEAGLRWGRIVNLEWVVEQIRFGISQHRDESLSRLWLEDPVANVYALGSERCGGGE